MSYITNGLSNKYQKHSKVKIREYLYNANEPEDNFDIYVSSKSDSEFLGNISIMKHNIRHRARMIRNSNK